jgi:cardiolipin synthase
MANHPDTHFTQKALQHAHSYGTQFVDGNRVTLLWKGTESFQTIFNRIQRAEKLICLEFYIFRDDETGNELAEILKKKATEGLEVNILYDHFGSLLTPGRFWKRLRDAGVNLRASRPFKWASPFEYVYRDHKKLIVIDGRYAFTGGLNIANEYRGVPMMKRKESWRDTGILLEGPIAAALMDIFKKSWKLWHGDHIGFQRRIDPIPGGLPVLPIFASSAKGRRKMRKLLYFSLNNAEKSIYLTTAYFTPSRRMQQVLAHAVSRGVDVKILIPGRSDILAAHYAGRASFKRMLDAGVEIHEYQGDILHAKSAVFDGIWSVIGSANLDFQSLRRNDEGNVGIIDRAFGVQMTELFFRDLENSVLITPEKWRGRPYTEKILENFFALFRRRL